MGAEDAVRAVDVLRDAAARHPDRIELLPGQSDEDLAVLETPDAVRRLMGPLGGWQLAATGEVLVSLGSLGVPSSGVLGSVSGRESRLLLRWGADLADWGPVLATRARSAELVLLGASLTTWVAAAAEATAAALEAGSDDAALREAVFAPHGDGATSLLRPTAAPDVVAGSDRDLALLASDLERVFEGRADVLEYTHIVDLRGEHRYPVRIPHDGAPDLHLLVLGDAEALALVRSDRDGGR